MSIPIPSFFKIRLVILIIAFFLLCFFVGLLRLSYSAILCKQLVVFNGYPMDMDSVAHYIREEWRGAAYSYHNYNYDIETDQITYDTKSTFNYYHVYNTNYIFQWYDTVQQKWFNSTNLLYGGPWAIEDVNLPSSGPPLQSGSDWTYVDMLWTDVRELGCQEQDCTDEKQLKILECGGEEYLEFWDNTTCSGRCYCEEDPDNPSTSTFKQLSAFCGSDVKVQSFDKEACTGKCKGCTDEYQQLEAACQSIGESVDLSTWNDETCSGECTQSCDDAFQTLESSCGIAGVNMATWNDSTCQGECNNDCTQEYNDLEDKCGLLGIKDFNSTTCVGSCNDCVERNKSCNDKCTGFVKSYECKDNTNTSGAYNFLEESECICDPASERLGDISSGNDLQGTPGQFGGALTNNPDGSITETLDNGDSVTYSADGKGIEVVLADGTRLSRKDNGDGTVTDTTIKGDGTYQITMYPKDDPEKEIKSEQGKLPPELVYSYNPTFNDSSSSIIVGDTTIRGDTSVKIGGSGGTTGTTDDTEETKYGPFLKPVGNPEYVPEEHDISLRTNEFLQQMQSTGLFSLPSKLTQGIPSGGSSDISINGGETFGGVHIISFSHLDEALLTLRAVFQIAFLFIAFRILTLKR